MTPSQWAETYRYLPASVTPEPGPWRNDRTPYLAEIMDTAALPGVERVVIIKGTQLGVSECTRNLLGYWIDHDPGPAMMVMPSQQAAEEVMEERVRPLLRETQKLKAHLLPERDANKLAAVRLDSMTLYMGWAGSAQALASRPIRYIIFDEVDKYPPFVGKESDPISLGLKRVDSFGHRARAIILSTPTVRGGLICSHFDDCTDKRYRHVPCPKCGKYQRMIWARVRWPAALDGETRQQHAERVVGGGLARYHCEFCDAQWTDAQRVLADRSGKWVSETPGASIRRVGFMLDAAHSPWVSLSKQAGEWIVAQGNPALLMDFANSRRAEPFEQQAATIKVDQIQSKAKLAGPPMVAPDWTVVLLGTADVQQDHLYYTIRAWGGAFRSQLIRSGMASSFDELAGLWYGQGYPRAGTGEMMSVVIGALDARYRTDEVLAFCQRDPARVWPVQGSSQIKTMPYSEKKVGGYNGVIMRMINPNHWKSVLHALIHDDDKTRWLPHNQIDETYCRQMSSEHQVHDPRTGVYGWQTIGRATPNHYWDCEVLQVMVGNQLGLGIMEVAAAQSRPRESDANYAGRNIGLQRRW